MGCDIHFYVEKRLNGKWVSADKWQKDEYGGMEVPFSDAFYNSRNYNLFAILADVRNGSGFAGIKTGEGFVPISEPRGLPDDVSDNVSADSERDGCDGHSHSYFSLAELLAYDWTQTTTLYGVVSASEYDNWKQTRHPNHPAPKSYCGAISGPDVKVIHESDMAALINKFDVIPDWNQRHEAIAKLHFHCRVTWTETYAQAVGAEWWVNCIPRLLRLGSPSDVRIVFWFDN